MNAPRLTHTVPIEQTSWFASPLGLLHIHHNRQHVFRLDYVSTAQGAATTQVATQVTALPVLWQQALLDYFTGELDALRRLPVQLQQGTDFQQQVWLSLRDIPAGQTCSYRQLAQAIGRPQAMRAVGQALSKNPISIILPCHRVILQSGGLGGYAGRSDVGQLQKQFLLWHECGFGAPRTSSCPPREITPQQRRAATD